VKSAPAVGYFRSQADGKPDNPQDKDPWADVRARFGDIYEKAEKAPRGRWAAIKDRLAIVAVILVLAVMVFLMLDGSFTNFRCTHASARPKFLLVLSG